MDSLIIVEPAEWAIIDAISDQCGAHCYGLLRYDPIKADEFLTANYRELQKQEAINISKQYEIIKKLHDEGVLSAVFYIYNDTEKLSELEELYKASKITDDDYGIMVTYGSIEIEASDKIIKEIRDTYELRYKGTLFFDRDCEYYHLIVEGEGKKIKYVFRALDVDALPSRILKVATSPQNIGKTLEEEDLSKNDVELGGKYMSAVFQRNDSIRKALKKFITLETHSIQVKLKADLSRNDLAIIGEYAQSTTNL